RFAVTLRFTQRLAKPYVIPGRIRPCCDGIQEVASRLVVQAERVIDAAPLEVIEMIAQPTAVMPRVFCHSRCGFEEEFAHPMPAVGSGARTELLIQDLTRSPDISGKFRVLVRRPLLVAQMRARSRGHRNNVVPQPNRPRANQAVFAAPSPQPFVT